MKRHHGDRIWSHWQASRDHEFSALATEKWGVAQSVKRRIIEYEARGEKYGLTLVGANLREGTLRINLGNDKGHGTLLASHRLRLIRALLAKRMPHGRLGIIQSDPEA